MNIRTITYEEFERIRAAGPQIGRTPKYAPLLEQLKPGSALLAFEGAAKKAGNVRTGILKTAIKLKKPAPLFALQRHEDVPDGAEALVWLYIAYPPKVVAPKPVLDQRVGQLCSRVGCRGTYAQDAAGIVACDSCGAAPLASSAPPPPPTPRNGATARPSLPTPGR